MEKKKKTWENGKEQARGASDGEMKLDGAEQCGVGENAIPYPLKSPP